MNEVKEGVMTEEGRKQTIEEAVLLMKRYADVLSGTGLLPGQVLPLADKITELAGRLRKALP